MNRFFRGILLFVLCVPVSLFAVKVAEDEIRSQIPTDIHFVNYSGERRHIDPIKDIRGIGEALSREIRKGKNRAGYGMLKYTLIHAIDTNENGKLDADILQIDPLACVDHIFGVRAILSGYLADQYGYGLSQAKALAVFITYYNAYYRKNTNYFESRFKRKVNGFLDPQKVGMSLSYEDWPGNSQIVIPLTLNGSAASELANDSVLSNMRNAKDKNIAARKELNKLRKESLKKEKQKLIQTNQSLLNKEKSIKEREKQLSQERKSLSQESNVIASLPEGPEKQKKQKELEQKQDDLKQKEQKLEEQKTDLASKKEKLNEKKQKLKEEEKKIEQEDKNIRSDEADMKLEKDTKAFQKELKKKDAELSEKEKKLAKVEQELKEGKTDKRIASGKLYYLKIKDYMVGGHYNNEMYLIDVLTHKIVKKSDFTNICGKDYHVFNNGVAVIGHGGGKGHSSGHFLVLLDGETLKVKAKGNADVFWRSFVEIRNNAFYAVIIKNRQFYLGKFDADLQLVATSEQAVFRDTFISFFGDVLYVSSADKGILVLNQSDLSLVDEVKPE